MGRESCPHVPEWSKRFGVMACDQCVVQEKASITMGEDQLITETLVHQFDLDDVDWSVRTARVGDFMQEDVVAPAFWSDNAVGIVAKLYFATVDGVRENSVRQLIERVAGRITDEGIGHGYFGEAEEARVFYRDLCYLLVNQMAAFNTPVWLNVGVPGRRQVCSACFLLSVEDRMHGDHSITEWWSTEARIFKGGAGSGVNVSKLRGSMESLSTGGTASGPLSYVRAADTAAGTMKSGGAHRRAAKMVILEADHPDIMDFIDSKRREDRRMRDLAAAGHEINPFTSSGEKVIAETTSFQNANISVGVSDAFMELATASPIAVARLGPDGLWALRARVTGDVVERVKASSVLDDIADAAWRCADPGVVFLDTVNRWHTTPVLRGKPAPITTCNPCAETWLNDDSSCNLASLNLVKFLDDDGILMLDEFRHAVDVMVTAMDITCSFSDLPTPEVEQNTRELRQLGLGYANLGAALAIRGMPYDSSEARDWAAAVTALMTGRAYRRSTELAQALGPYKRFEENRDAHLRVVQRHTQSVPEVYDSAIWAPAMSDWAHALEDGRKYGYRNSQVTVLAPTGTISYMMDCDTTGIEPAFSHYTYKGLAGGGQMTLLNRSAIRAAKRLGYTERDIMDMESGNFSGVTDGDSAVFATANEISPMGHLGMVIAVAPWLSGAPSKTINLANTATVGDIKEVLIEAWRGRCKAVSVYRNGSKATQVLSSTDPAKTDTATAAVPSVPVRLRMPATRRSVTHKFSVGGYEGYLTAGMYDDGRLGEFFLTDVGKEGSFTSGIMGSWAIACSVAFQHGVPLPVLAKKYIGTEFAPKGVTSDPLVPSATSLPDYLFKWLVAQFCDADTCEELGVRTAEVKQRMTDRLDRGEAEPVGKIDMGLARLCSEGCGGLMYPSGSCYTCSSCGANTGCG